LTHSTKNKEKRGGGFDELLLLNPPMASTIKLQSSTMNPLFGSLNTANSYSISSAQDKPRSRPTTISPSKLLRKSKKYWGMSRTRGLRPVGSGSRLHWSTSGHRSTPLNLQLRAVPAPIPTIGAWDLIAATSEAQEPLASCSVGSFMFLGSDERGRGGMAVQWMKSSFKGSRLEVYKLVTIESRKVIKL
jgi:hypothetical protein